jgi:hypothetical protein
MRCAGSHFHELKVPTSARVARPKMLAQADGLTRRVALFPICAQMRPARGGNKERWGGMTKDDYKSDTVGEE